MSNEDAYGLARFLKAQESVYESALQEICAGKKEGHWMWSIFPQHVALGSSHRAKKFGIASKVEASHYLAHPILGERLLECVEAIVQLNGKTAYEIFGTVDSLKLKSSATLFGAVSTHSAFRTLIDKFFEGNPDDVTLKLIADEA